MFRTLMIKAESLDWCGINDIFVFYTELEDEEMALNSALEQYEDVMCDFLYSEYYTSDESDEDFMEQEDAAFSFTAEWYTEENYGIIADSPYHALN